jgi:hypothetical protein
VDWRGGVWLLKWKLDVEGRSWLPVWDFVGSDEDIVTK